MFSLQRIVILSFALFLAACEQATILSPTDNFVAEDNPSTFSVQFSQGAGIPKDLNLQLNLADVTTLFDVSASGAEANGDDLSAYIFSGLNTFRVTAYNKVRQVEFYVDTDGPKIHILDTDKTNNVITGYVEDSAGVQSLTLDGINVNLDENYNFTTSYQNLAFNTFVAVDGFNHVSETTFARNTNSFNGLSARLNQGGLDFLVQILEQEILDADFNNLAALVGQVNILQTGLYDLSGQVTNISLGGLDLDLEALDNEAIASQLDISDFVITVDFQSQVLSILGIIPIIGDLLTGFTTHNFTADINVVQLDGSSDVLIDIQNSDLDFSIANTEVNFERNDILVDIQSRDGNVLQNLVTGTLDAMAEGFINFFVPLLKPMIIRVVENTVVPMLSDFLKDIPIDLRIVTLAENEEVRVTANPSFLDTKDQGITIDLGTRIWAPEPSAMAPGVLGSHYREGDTPSLGAVTPDGEAFDFGVMISENVVNQALAAAQEAGITTLMVSPGFYDLLTPDGIQVFTPQDVEIATNDQIGFRFLPASAPTVKFQSGRADSAAGVLSWQDLSFALDLYKDEWGEFRTLFGLTLNLEVPFEVDATADGYLAIGIEELPEIQVIGQEVYGSILLPLGFVNSSINYLMPLALPTIAERLKTIALPRIYQHTVNMNDFWVAGSGNNSLALAGSLIPLSVMEAAAAPTTTIDQVVTENVVVAVESDTADGIVVVNENINVVNGEATIDLAALTDTESNRGTEYRYRVDNGAWSIWKGRDRVKLRNLLAGSHEIQICARNRYMKTESACPVVEFDTRVVRETE